MFIAIWLYRKGIILPDRSAAGTGGESCLVTAFGQIERSKLRNARQDRDPQIFSRAKRRISLHMSDTSTAIQDCSIRNTLSQIQRVSLQGKGGLNCRPVVNRLANQLLCVANPFGKFVDATLHVTAILCRFYAGTGFLLLLRHYFLLSCELLFPRLRVFTRVLVVA